MKQQRSTVRAERTAAVLRAATGLVAAVLMVLQTAAVSAHTHAPTLPVTQTAHAVAEDFGDLPMLPLPAGEDQSCPLGHSPFHSGGVIAPGEASGLRLAIERAPGLPGAELDPVTARGPPSPPARAPPLHI